MSTQQASSFFQRQEDRVRSRFSGRISVSNARERLGLARARSARSRAVSRGEQRLEYVRGKGSATAIARAEAAQSKLAAAQAALVQAAKQKASARLTAKVEAKRRRDMVKGAWIAADATVTRLTLQWLNLVARPVADAMRAEVIPLAEKAFDLWPIRTGQSRDGLTLDVSRKGETQIIARFSGHAGYSYLIKYGRRATSVKGRLPQGKHVWTALVRKPFKGAEQRIAERIVASLDKEF